MSDEQLSPFDLKPFRDGQADAQTLGQLGKSGVALGKIITALVVFSGMWGYMLTRARIGSRRLIVLGLASTFIASLIVPPLQDSPAFPVIAWWFNALIVVFLFRLVYRAGRSFIGPRTPRIHSREIGDFLPPLTRLVERMWPGQEISDKFIGLVLEPAVFALLGGVVFLYERSVADRLGEPMTYAFVMFWMTAAGMFIQYTLLAIDSAKQLTRLLDQEQEQGALAQTFGEQRTSELARQAEGYAEVGV